MGGFTHRAPALSLGHLCDVAVFLDYFSMAEGDSAGRSQNGNLRGASPDQFACPDKGSEEVGTAADPQFRSAAEQ